MQRVLREAGGRVSARSDRQAEIGLELVSALADAKAHHLHGLPFVSSLLEHTKYCQTSYLAHEYMCDAWRPCFHADVASDLAKGKFDWIASANLLENFLPLMLSDEARSVFDRFDDPVMRELVKDMCLPRGLRQDVFVRGAQRIPPDERDARLGEITLGLICDASEFSWEVEVPSGQAAFERRFFGPVINTLSQGPQRVRDLLELPDLPRRDNPGELVGMLVGTDQALPMLTTPAAPDPQVRRFNMAAAKRFVRSGNLNTGMALAASGTGAPIPCPMLDLFVAARLEEGASDPTSWAATLGAGRPEAERERLRAFIDRLVEKSAPIWRRLGALSPCVRPAV